MESLRAPNPEGPLVRRLIGQGIRDPRVLAAFARVPRRFFVPDESQEQAEGDHPLEIGYGQTISQPYIVGAMTEALQLEGRERVLEVGNGSGYQTALLCELLPLTATGEFRAGDGALGWPEAAPFDAILVAAAPEQVPAPLLEQLAPGGRLVIPVGASPEHQELQLWRKLPGTGALDRKVL